MNGKPFCAIIRKSGSGIRCCRHSSRIGMPVGLAMPVATGRATSASSATSTGRECVRTILRFPAGRSRLPIDWDAIADIRRAHPSAVNRNYIRRPPGRFTPFYPNFPRPE